MIRAIMSVCDADEPTVRHHRFGHLLFGLSTDECQVVKCYAAAAAPGLMRAQQSAIGVVDFPGQMRSTRSDRTLIHDKSISPGTFVGPERYGVC